jgi:UDP:flavonoid glycosyltransferase YjiC (YdhE family)
MGKDTIVFAPATFNLAETSRMLEIAKALNGQFYCHFFGFSEKYSYLIEENHFPFWLLDPILSTKEVTQIMALDQMKGIKNPFTKKMVQARVNSELDLLAKLNPKIVVTGTNVTIFLSARIAKIPVVYVKPYALSVPYFVDKRENKTLFDSFMLRCSWIPGAFKNVAKHHGLPLPKRTLDLLEGDYNLVTTSNLFYPYEELPETYFPVGPIYAKLGENIPVAVLNFVANVKQQNKTLVYFAVGSSGNRSFVKRVLKVLIQQGLHVIAPVNTFLTKEERKLLSPKVLCCDWLPAHLVSELVDFSVIHGGEGTVQTACASGKPFIGFALQMEQKINLSYCEQYGNAIRLKTSQIYSEKFKRAIEAIQTQKYIEKAKELKENFAIDGSQTAAELIGEIIENRASRCR